MEAEDPSKATTMMRGEPHPKLKYVLEGGAQCVSTERCGLNDVCKLVSKLK